MRYLTEEMFSAGKPVAQGEVLIWMKKFAPKAVLDGLASLKNLTQIAVPEEGYILGHSETGHNHVLTLDRETKSDVPFSKAAQILIDSANDNLIEMRLSAPCALVHNRDFDAHDTIVLPPGDYIRGIREDQTVEGWRRSAD